MYIVSLVIEHEVKRQMTSCSVHWSIVSVYVDIATPSLSWRLCFTISINRPHPKIKSNKCVKQWWTDRYATARRCHAAMLPWEFWDEGSFSTWNWLAGKSGSNHILSKGRPPSYTPSSNFSTWSTRAMTSFAVHNPDLNISGEELSWYPLGKSERC